MASGDIRLCVGLGNPGEKYKNTRHNIGFMILEKLAVQQGCDISNNKKLYGRLSQVNLGEQRIWTLMPNTFMNDSGKSIQAALNWFNLKPDQLLILVDDIDLPLGKIRMRTSGSSGGHNGLKSTIQHLGSKEFARIRIGIGSPSERQIERKAKTISHVLGVFKQPELEIVNTVIEEVLIGLRMIHTDGLEKASTHLNSYKCDKNSMNNE